MSLLQINEEDQSNHCMPAADTESNGKLLPTWRCQLALSRHGWVGHCQELCWSLPGQVTYLESGTAVTEDSEQALCSDFVSKPVSSPPLPPSQSKQVVTLHCHKLTPSQPCCTQEEKNTPAVQELGVKDPLGICTRETFAVADLLLRWYFTGQLWVPLPSLSARRMQDAWTQGGNNDKCSGTFKLFTGSLSF